jgi:hypothetical protein
MGVGGSYSRSKLIYFINMTEQKLNDISQYFQKIGKIERANPKFEHYTTIILIVLREIENIMDKLNPGKENYLNVPQYNFSFKKLFNIRFKEVDFKDEIITNFKKKIINIKFYLSNLIPLEELETNLKYSVIEDIVNPNEKDPLLNIIENAYKNNFHKFFINEYIHYFIKLKIDGKNIYTKEVLAEVKMAKYIAQILIFIKLFVKYVMAKKDQLSEEEIIQSSRYVFNEEFVLSNFILYECNMKTDKINPDLKNDNEMALGELIKFYLKLLQLIKLIKDKIGT